MSMTVAFKTVLVMLLYALPGYIMIKTKLIAKDMISAFAKLLLYLCQPALIKSVKCASFMLLKSKKVIHGFHNFHLVIKQ